MEGKGLTEPFDLSLIHIYRTAEALSERTGGHVNAAGALHIAMAGQLRAGTIERLSLIHI